MGEELVDEIEEERVGLGVAQDSSEEVAGEESDGRNDRIVEVHDSHGHDVAEGLQRSVFADVEDADESRAGEHNGPTATSGWGIAVVDEKGNTAALAREAVDDRARVVVFNGVKGNAAGWYKHDWEMEKIVQK